MLNNKVVRLAALDFANEVNESPEITYDTTCSVSYSPQLRHEYLALSFKSLILPLGWWELFCHAMFALLLLILSYVSLNSVQINPSFFEKHFSIPPGNIPYVFIIFAVAIPFTQALIIRIQQGFRFLYQLNTKPELAHSNRWPPLITGYLEGFLYPVVFILGRPEFIAVWWAMKLGGTWNEWKTEYVGRKRFQVFLQGNALSLISGYIIYQIIRVLLLNAIVLV